LNVELAANTNGLWPHEAHFLDEVWVARLYRVKQAAAQAKFEILRGWVSCGRCAMVRRIRIRKAGVLGTDRQT